MLRKRVLTFDGGVVVFHEHITNKTDYEVGTSVHLE